MSRLPLIMKYFLCLVLGLGAAIMLLWIFNRDDPKYDARYSDISLEIEPSLSSPLLNALVAPAHSESALWEGLGERFQHHDRNASGLRHAAYQKSTTRSPNDRAPDTTPDSTLWSKISEFQTLHQSYRDALEQPGCLDDLAQPLTGRIKWTRLIWGARLVALRFEHQAQEEALDERILEFLGLLRSVERKRGECHLGLVSQFVFTQAVSLLHQPLLKVVVDPELSPITREAMLSFWRGVLSKAHRSARVTSMQNSLRVDYALVKRHMEQTMEASIQRDFGMSSDRLWPLIDLEQLAHWQAERARSMIWRTAWAPHRPLTEDLEIDRFIARIELPWLYLSYNPIGQLLYKVAVPNSEAFIERYHEEECLLAASIVRGLAPLNLEPQITVLNPFTHNLIQVSQFESETGGHESTDLEQLCRRPVEGALH